MSGCNSTAVLRLCGTGGKPGNGQPGDDHRVEQPGRELRLGQHPDVVVQRRLAEDLQLAGEPAVARLERGQDQPDDREQRDGDRGQQGRVQQDRLSRMCFSSGSRGRPASGSRPAGSGVRRTLRRREPHWKNFLQESANLLQISPKPRTKGPSIRSRGRGATVSRRAKNTICMLLSFRRPPAAPSRIAWIQKIVARDCIEHSQ